MMKNILLKMKNISSKILKKAKNGVLAITKKNKIFKRRNPNPKSEKAFFHKVSSGFTKIVHKFKKSPKTEDVISNHATSSKKKIAFNHPLINKIFSIRAKLIFSYIVPVVLMVVLGIVSFSRASTAIIVNYEGSISQAVNMTKEYFNFAFSSLEAQINTYLFDDEINNHLKGVNILPQDQYDLQKVYKQELTNIENELETLQEGTLAYYEKQVKYLEAKIKNDNFASTINETETRQRDTYKKINSDIGMLASSNPFIQNVFIINDAQDPLTTVLKLRPLEDNFIAETDEKVKERTLKQDYYTPFIETEFGKKVMANKTSFHWNGAQPELDAKYQIDSDKYCLRIAHAYTDTANSYAIIDISTNAVMGILDDLHIGEGSYLGFISPDGQEVVSMSTDAVTSDGESGNGGEEATATEDGKASKTDKEKDGKETSKEETKEDNKENADENQEVVFSDKEFYQTAMESEQDSGLEYVSYKGGKYLFMFSKVGDSDSLLCALVPYSSIIGQVSGIRTLTVILVIIASIISMFIGTLISTDIGKTINIAVKHLITVSKGDLTKEFHTNRRDEFAQLANGTTDMIVNIRSLIRKLETVYKAFLEALHLVDDTSGTFNRTSKDIQTAVHEIEIGITQQSDDAADCLEQMDSLFNRIGVVNDNASEISTIASSTSSAITESLTTMNELKEKTKSTTDITNNVIWSIVDLEKKSRNIKQIVNAINDIAEETNLLSLNASIEAAKAGSAGRGFAVVADQIRKLADQSLTASSKINEIIAEIIDTTKSAAKTAEKAETIVNLQVAAVDNTSESFNNMSKRVEELIEKLTLIQSSAKSMEDSGSATLNSMESISSILEETSAASTSVTEIVDKQTEALSDLDKAATLLMERAKELDVAIHQFKTR